MKRYAGSSGGQEVGRISGLGQLAPGRYSVECSFMKNMDTYCVVCLTTPTGDYHSETLKEWPSWLHEGLNLKAVIGLSPGVIVVRDGKQYALMDHQTKELKSSWLTSVRDVRGAMQRNGLRQATPVILELSSGNRLFTFAKTKPHATHAPDSIDIPRAATAAQEIDETQDDDTSGS